MANVRIKDLTTDSALAAGDYVVIDSASEGSRKFDLGTELADLKSEISEISGISEDVKTALLQIASKAVYVDDGGPTYYQDLYDALYPPAQTYTVTNTLTGCTTNNAAASVTENAPYSATITASSGYSLTGATVSITMGGTDITATAYNNGAISIASVTGNLIITVTAVAVTLSSISAVYTQSGTVYDTDTLDSLKTDLVVTATWSDASTSTVASADYTLSGTLTAGTSTITVTYGGKTDTFNVTVTQADTTAVLVKEGYVQVWSNNQCTERAATNGGITKMYDIPSTNILYPAGVIPYWSGSVDNDVGIIMCYDDNGNHVGHVSEKVSSDSRWCKVYSGTLTEYSKSWTLQGNYTKISFNLDKNYLSKAYMYDKTTGRIFFAGSDTPYYGMSNISEAQS